MLPGPVPSASPENLVGIKMLRLHPTGTELEIKDGATNLNEEQRGWTTRSAKFAKGDHTFDSKFPRSHYRKET